MKKFQRLTKNVSPLHYKITMQPNLDDFTFKGSEVVSLKIDKPTKKIILHAVDLKITDVFWQSGKDTIPAMKISFQKKDETATLEFDAALSGKGKLGMHFSGQLTDQLRGYYKSAYQHGKQTKHISISQFEATDARRAFPSFDEPAHKAVFEVSLIVPKKHIAISNTIERAVEQHDPGYKIVHFEPSPKMSTYLLAFITGEFEQVKTKTKDGVLIRVFTTPGKIAHAKFALDVAKRALEYLNEYFAIPYPLPILDLIAIPDFAAGAMENWGAVTFSETALLIDEQNSNFIAKERVAEVIAHELVHQWFGNLVTMEWWTHLWLNESFATYMAFKTVDHIFPEWNIMTKFVLNELMIALQKDALISAQPVEVEVHSPNEISESFDPAIVYAKGASVLRMLENYIGADNYQEGLRLYLKKHSYKNTSSIHLWEAFEKIAKKPVRKLMAGWTLKSGYPVVKATLRGDMLKLEQQKFKFLNDKTSDLWFVPVQAQLFADRVTDVFELQKSKAQFKISADREFVKLNAHQYGYYRAAYDPSLLAELLTAARDKKLTVVDRIGLVSDLFELAKGGFASTDVFLEAVNILGAAEDSYVVWAQLSGSLIELFYLLDVKERARLADFALLFYSNLLNKLGWQPRAKETTSQSLLRAVAISGSGLFGDSKAIAKTHKILKLHAKGKLIHPDLRAAVYNTAARNGSEPTWQILKKLYGQAGLQEESIRLAVAMTQFAKPNQIKQSLQFIFSDKIRVHVLPFLLYAGMQNPITRSYYWAEIKKRWPELEAKYAKGSLLSRIVSGVRHFSTAAELKDVQQFFRTHNHSGAEQKLKQAIEDIRINIQWKTRDQKAIRKYLKSA